MNKVKVIGVDSDGISFDNGMYLTSEHERDCCEHHYLEFSDLTIGDFEGLEFDLTTEEFFERIEGYGIALIPLMGHPVKIPGYGVNNGYYSDNLDLVLRNKPKVWKEFNITDCQQIFED